MVELPKAPGQSLYPACRLCAARVGFDKCNDSVFDEFNPSRAVSKYRPGDCPLTEKPVSGVAGAAEAILRGQLRRQS